MSVQPLAIVTYWKYSISYHLEISDVMTCVTQCREKIQAGNIVTSVTHVTHHGRDLITSVTHVTHRGRDLNIAQRMLPSYRILPTLYTHCVHVCGLHTQACIRMLPMLHSVIGCYRVLSMLPTMYVVHTQACIYMLPMLPSVIVLSMLHTMYVVYTHRPAYICYHCYPVLSDVTKCYQCYPLCMRSTHTGLHICYQCYPVLSDVTEFYQCYPLCMWSHR